MSSQKKRKSDVNIDQIGSGQPTKKDKPWYSSVEASSEISKFAGIDEDHGKEGRRTSFIGGLLKKMRSSSTLKERNRATSSSVLSLSAVSSEPEPLPRLSSSTSVTRLPEDSMSDASYISDASHDSSIFQRNIELHRFVENVEDSSEGISLYSTTSLSSDNSASINSFCTPSRNFQRDKLRSSVRSMPGQDDMVNALCNSVVRRTGSSASDSVSISPARFLRNKSLRFIRKLSSTVSSLDEPQEMNIPFAPLTEVDETQDNEQVEVTPTVDANTSIASAQNTTTERKGLIARTKSRVFKRRSVNSSHGTPEISLLADPVTPARKLQRTTPSSSSLQRKVSNAIKKVRGSSINLSEWDEKHQIKRAETDKGRGKPTIPTSTNRRHSDVSNITISGIHSSLRDSGLKDRTHREARLFLKQALVGELPVLELLESNEYDAVLVDVLTNGVPASPTAVSILSDGSADIVRDMVLRNTSAQILVTRERKPSLICVKVEPSQLGEGQLARNVRTGIGSGLREAFVSKEIKKLLVYPTFCNDETEWDNVAECIDQLLLIVHKALSWNVNPDGFDSVTMAGITIRNVELLKERYGAFVENLRMKLPS